MDKCILLCFEKELSLRSDGRFDKDYVFEPQFLPDLSQMCLLYGISVINSWEDELFDSWKL